MKLFRHHQIFIERLPTDAEPNFKRFSAVLTFVFFVLIFFGLPSGYAQVTPTGVRPATVPAEYIGTPFGYFHPTCVQHLEEGDVLLKDQHAVQHSAGNVDTIPACNHPRYDMTGDIVSDTSSAVPTIGHSYVEAVSATTGSSFGELVADWTVPPPPTSHDGQILFFFPGMIDTATAGNSNGSILQPVLAWNKDYPNAWGIASWNCCITGITWESKAVSVSAGDVITGTIKSTCNAGTLSCSSWTITTTDLTSGGTTTLGQSSSDGQTFNEAFGGTLEVAGVTQCSDYPPNGSITFSNLALYNNNFGLISGPNWSFDNYFAQLTPQCFYSGDFAPQKVLLEYGLPSPNVVTTEAVCHGSFGGCSYAVSMSDGNPSAAIYYTTDGSIPTMASSLYNNGQVGYTPTTTFKAIAVIGSSQSPVTTYVATGGIPF